METRYQGKLLKNYLIYFLCISISGCEDSRVVDNLRYHKSQGVLSTSHDCVRPDYYRFRLNSIRIDRDGDRMDDEWEQMHGLDPSNPNDGSLDPDNDGYSNLEEFRDDTFPFSAHFYPGRIAVTTQGFDCFYVVEMGFINEDELLDLLIRDSNEKYVPAVRDFVMIQQPDHSFSIEDAENYSIPELTDISSILTVAELNLDDSKDIVMSGLSSLIPNVEDKVIVYGPICEICYERARGGIPIPLSHLEVDHNVLSFFSDFENWVNDENYFVRNAERMVFVPSIESADWLIDGNTGLSDQAFSTACEQEGVACFDVVVDESDPLLLSAEDAILFRYTHLPYQLKLSDREKGPNQTYRDAKVIVKFNSDAGILVQDYSEFNSDAVDIAQILSASEEIDIPWIDVNTVRSKFYHILDGNLQFHGFVSPDWGILEYASHSTIVGSIQRSLYAIVDKSRMQYQTFGSFLYVLNERASNGRSRD